MKNLTPFALVDVENVEMVDRGYSVYSTDVIYDPLSQTSNLVNFGGPSEPTTMSNCADTSGNVIVGYDSDESSDDTGTD